MSESITLTDFPQNLANALGIDLFSGQILASVIFLLLTLFPVILITKGKNQTLMIIMAVMSLSFCVAVAWLPVWTLAVIVLMIAIMGANKFKEMI